VTVASLEMGSTTWISQDWISQASREKEQDDALCCDSPSTASRELLGAELP
jgi:hypothetical protein